MIFTYDVIVLADINSTHAVITVADTKQLEIIQWPTQWFYWSDRTSPYMAFQGTSSPALFTWIFVERYIGMCVVFDFQFFMALNLPKDADPKSSMRQFFMRLCFFTLSG